MALQDIMYDQFFDFLKSRNLQEIIPKLEKEKIDQNVLLLMDEKALSTYFPLYGDRLAVLDFCKRQTFQTLEMSRKEKLLQKLRKKLCVLKRPDPCSDEEDKRPTKHMGRYGNSNAKKSARKIEIGWLQKENQTSDLKQVRTKSGGGTRKLSVLKSATKEDILNMAKNIFFPNGKSSHGSVEEFDFDITNFEHKSLMDEYTVGELYDQTKLPLLRFYMVTCKKEIINHEAVCRSKTLLEEKETPNIHKSLSNVPASSPAKSRDLNERLVSNSQNEAIFVVPDALISESCKAGCSHTLLDFPADASNSANHFTFDVNKHQKINEEGLDYNYINYEIPKSPEECQKEDKQCTEHDISNDAVFSTLSDDSNIIVFGPSFESDVLSDTILLESTTCFMEFELIVRRGNAMEDIVHTFEKNPEIYHGCTLKIKRLLPSGEKEEADDFGGVICDALAEFWEEFYNKCTLGKTFRVPFLRHDFTLSKWRAIAKVIFIGYEQCRYFPVQLAPAFMQQVFFGSIEKNSTLLDSFMKFVPSLESEVLQMAISNFTEVELPELIEVLQEHSCKRLPKADNIQQIIMEIAHKELIQEPMFVIDIWTEVLKNIMFTVTSLNKIYEEAVPDSKKVRKMVHFPNEMNQNQKTVSNYLVKFNKELDDSELATFLRFCTGSDIICTENIDVTFVNLEGLARRPVSHTCGGVLELPDNYESYPEFRSEFLAILKSGIWVMDIV